jgi:hypothetical protein
MQIAKIYEEQRNYNSALEYAANACEIYSKYYQEEHEMNIMALWLKVSI